MECSTGRRSRSVPAAFLRPNAGRAPLVHEVEKASLVPPTRIFRRLRTERHIPDGRHQWSPSLSLVAGPLAVRAPRPAAGSALAVLQLLLGPADAARSCGRLLGILDPADELVAGQRCDVLPGVECRGVGDQRSPEVCWKLVHHPTRHSRGAHRARVPALQACSHGVARGGLVIAGDESPCQTVPPLHTASVGRCWILRRSAGPWACSCSRPGRRTRWWRTRSPLDCSGLPPRPCRVSLVGEDVHHLETEVVGCHLGEALNHSQKLLGATVGPAETVASRHVPHDVIAEHLEENFGVAGVHGADQRSNAVHGCGCHLFSHSLRTRTRRRRPGRPPFPRTRANAHRVQP